MRWVAIFDDTVEMNGVRAIHEPAHMEYLRKHEAEIVIAGGLRDEPGGLFCGGLWVMEVQSRQRAVELVEADPYFLHRARRYRLQIWGKAFAEKEVIL